MYLGYEVTWNWYLFDDKRWPDLGCGTSTRASDAHDSAHLQLFASPDSPGLFALEGTRKTSLLS
jgi:hypothetical protein